MEKCNLTSEENSSANESTEMKNKEIEAKQKFKNVPTGTKITRKFTNQLYEKLNRYDKELLGELDRESIIVNFNEDVNHHIVNQQLIDTQEKRQSVKENQILDLEKKFQKTEANLHRLCSELSSDEAYKQLFEKCVPSSDQGFFSSIRRHEEEAKLHYKRLPISVQKKFEEYCCRIAGGSNNKISSMSQEIRGRLPLQSPRSPSPSSSQEGNQVEYSVMDDVPTTRRSPHYKSYHRKLSPSSASSSSSASEDTDEPDERDSAALSCPSIEFSIESLPRTSAPTSEERPPSRKGSRRRNFRDTQLARASINGMLMQYCEEQELTETLTKSMLHEYTTTRGLKNIIRGARNQDMIAMKGLIMCVTDMQKLRREMDEVRRTTRTKAVRVAKEDPPDPVQNDNGEMQIMEYVQGNRYAVQDDALSKVNMLQQAKSDIMDIFGKSRIDQTFLKKVTEPPRWKS